MAVEDGVRHMGSPTCTGRFLRKNSSSSSKTGSERDRLREVWKDRWVRGSPSVIGDVETPTPVGTEYTTREDGRPPV